MIVDEMRVLPGNQRGVEVATAYLQAIEADDIAWLKRQLAPHVVLRHASYPPVEGRDEALNLILGYRQIVGGVEFDVRTLVGGENLITIEKVNVATLLGGAQARIPTVTILEFGDDQLIFSIRVYADIADLFRRLDRSEGQPVRAS